MATFHPRLLGGVILGFVAWVVVCRLGLHGAAAVLVGWNIGAFGYLAAIWRLYLTAAEDDVRTRAAQQDESPLVIATLAALAILASLLGVFVALTAAKGADRSAGPFVTSLSGLTLVSTWFVVQSLFVAHYAHRHFQAVAKYGRDSGFSFPGDPPAGYLDFAYLALCVGATAQVSDTGVQSRALRTLVTAHAVTAFFYNTAVLALGVNILSGLLGR